MEKRINRIDLRLEDSLFLELNRLAVIQNRTATDMAHLIVFQYLYGHRTPSCQEYEENQRGYEGLKNYRGAA